MKNKKGKGRWREKNAEVLDYIGPGWRERQIEIVKGA